MAKKDDKKRSSNGLIKKLTDTVQNNLDYLYQKTYYSQPGNKQDLDNVKNKLDSSIDNIVAVNRNNTGNGTMSALYSRLQQAPTLGGSGDEGAKKLEELINDNQVIESGLMGFINNTTTVFDYDNKIDTILKYMPKLQEALDTRKDNVLSADHFSKDFINITTSNINSDSETYNEHIKYIKETYKIQDLVDEIYDKASKYGEAFVYIVPYKKAVVRLLRQKNNIRADLNIKEGTIFTESGNIGMDALPKDLTAEDFNAAGYGDIQVEFSQGLINSIAESVVKFEKSAKLLNEMSLNYEGANLSEETINEAAENVRDVIKGQFDRTIKDDLSFEGFDDRGQDGLVDKNKANKKKGKDDKYVNVPGTIIRILERKHVIPIYIDEYCFGYYYIEVEGPYNPVGDYDKMQDPTMSLKGSNSILSTNSMMDQTQKQNNIIRYLSNQISNLIDAKFINTNQDLRQEIYTILKYNQDNNSSKMNKIRVTFIPPDDMEHVYFKMNKDTHRGISDLDKSMFPGTLFSSMYITHCIWNMTRAQDKRVYYVNQNVDTNISKTLLNTINQIKKGNFGIRQIENINHILNITGMFNDYIIPRGPGGNTPIDFEVMQGQSVEYQTELMTMLEEAAVNACEVPMEMIQMRNSVDYASQLTMSSSKFLRKVYNRQSKFQKNLTRIINNIYNNEFDDNITLNVMLPPPMFLNLTNTNQMMTNVNEYSQSVAQLILDPDEEEPVKNEVIREVNKFHLGTYINLPELEEIAHRAKQHMAANSNDDNGEE
jgi:hypothetical protein